MARRYKVHFSNEDSYYAARAFETASSTTRVLNEQRRFIALELPPALQNITEAERTLDTQINSFAKYYGATITEDIQFDMEASSDIFNPLHFGPETPGQPSLDDVRAMILAEEAWAFSQGQGITIAVVDTGINGNRPEFPSARRVGHWEPVGDTSWTDWNGHGTMCACIAAGSTSGNGLFNGIAPDAGIIACKTYFYATELTAIYDYLTGLANQGMTIIATNSYGMQTGTPPSPPADPDFLNALMDAVAAGVHIFFSAGNYHDLAGGDPDECNPTSIWLHKCREDVMSVATCKLDKTMWYYSSRGPGQHFGNTGTNRKPDVTAPTPQNGRIIFGDTIRSLPDGWGTSGACPQVAGLAALLLAKKPSLTRVELFDAIRSTATTLGHSVDCQGAGMIDCKQAIDTVNGLV